MSDLPDAAIHEAFLANRRLVVEASGEGALEEAAGWQLYDSGTGLRGINQAMAVQRQGSSASLAAVEAWYRRREAPFCLVLRDSTDAAVLAAAKAAGYVPERRQPVMAQGLPFGARRTPRVEYREVRSLGDALRFLEVRRDPTRERPKESSESEFIVRLVASGQFKYFIAEVDGEAVGGATTTAPGEIAVVANVFVAPAWRRRGLGSEVTSKAAGVWPKALFVALEASREGAFLYSSMGFETRYHYVRMTPPVS